jgi:uncharacterized membrane protein/mono/diheme cytochrome c family protein
VSAATSMAVGARRLLPKNRATQAAWLITLVVIVSLTLLPWIVRLDGRPHADWQKLLGRFHPLAVHLPIGLLVLMPILEIAGIFRMALREAAGFVLGLAFAASALALTLGYLLAYGSGDAGSTVTYHMWGGIALVIGVLLCLLVRPSWYSGTSPYAYPILLTCTLFALLWTAHEGGSITHGSNYLTQYMPASLKRLSPERAVLNASRASSSTSFYTKHIHPIFDAHCVSCHGESKTSGGLRLDSYDRLMRGGTDGVVIVPGNPDKSLLLTRVTLPAGHKLLMPAEGRPRLRPEEIAWIRAWIQQGSSPSDLTVAGVSIPDQQSDVPLIPVGDYSTLEPFIQQMAKGQDAKLMPVSSKPSDGLVLYTVDAASSFSDARLQQFQNFAPYIVEAELGRTAVTDASFDTLAKFTHLRALHLEGTAITGSNLAKLAPLSQLTYLNLSETKVTSAAIAPLASMKNLRHLYLFNTPAQTVPAVEAQQTTSQTTSRSTQ